MKRERAHDVTAPRDPSAVDIFTHSTAALIEEATQGAKALHHDSDAESIHRLRVTVRRLRSIWWVYRPLLPAPERGRQEAGLKLITTAAGKARDWDILVELFTGRRRGKRALQFVDELSARRKEALEASHAELESIDVESTLNTAFEQATSALKTADPMPARRFARRGAKSAEATLRKRMKRANKAKRSDYAAFHDVRKAAKRLRYALEFFDGESSTDHERVLKALKDIQQRYGALNDVVTSDAMLRAEFPERASEIRWLEKKRKRRLRKAERLLPGSKRLWPD